MPYIPTQGDIIFLDFSPQAGHEQAGRSPAVVVSNSSFFRYTHTAMVCPITNTNNHFPLHVALDSTTATTGVILCEHCKSLDISARNAVYVESLSQSKLDEVLKLIRLFF